MIVRPQIYKTHDGTRLITHGIWASSGEFVAFSRCFCQAMKAIRGIEKAVFGQTLRAIK